MPRHHHRRADRAQRGLIGDVAEVTGNLRQRVVAHERGGASDLEIGLLDPTGLGSSGRRDPFQLRKRADPTTFSNSGSSAAK